MRAFFRLTITVYLNNLPFVGIEYTFHHMPLTNSLYFISYLYLQIRNAMNTTRSEINKKVWDNVSTKATKQCHWMKKKSFKLSVIKNKEKVWQ